ncbi:hypothetical protein C2869_08805 [Saccharobesus litoralis]|uniref:diguanylate cyclase n=1 Tax=Saccharobesus litoralis TaxID=2172099 RepID=A0A2S0VR13_9ALTE|nr:diguanylate cyclase [Saccharobesus litoralis]AWB66520.1 hypothetical protein C2869_08805 [Saccharobesus litoralis]
MLQVFLDLNCPYSYILHERLINHPEYSVIQWHYVEHLPTLEAQDHATIHAQLLVDIDAIKKIEPNLPINAPEFCINSRLAILSLMMVEKCYPQKAASYRSFLFRAYWQYGVDISRFDALHAILASLSTPWLDYDNDVEHRQLLSQKHWQQGDYSHHLPVLIGQGSAIARGLLSNEKLDEFLGGELHTDAVAEGCDFSGEYHIACIGKSKLAQDWRLDTYGFNLSIFDDFSQYDSQTRGQQFDAILVDFGDEHDERNQSLCAVAEAKRNDLDYPIICILDNPNPAVESLALNLGANDTLLVQDDVSVQLTRIKKRINTHKAISILSRHAYVDGLTGLFNKRSFEKSYIREWRIAARSNLPLSVILLDFDYFKRFNDTYGHCAGDDCLKALSQVIKTSLFRPSDSAARFGGEEFILLLPDTDLESALIVANRIRKSITKKRILHAEHPNSDYVTVSLGVACAKKVANLKSGDLIQLADTALYKAKNGGRDQAYGLLLD